MFGQALAAAAAAATVAAAAAAWGRGARPLVKFLSIFKWEARKAPEVCLARWMTPSAESRQYPHSSFLCLKTHFVS